jgi:hypothetical protein
LKKIPKSKIRVDQAARYSTDVKIAGRIWWNFRDLFNAHPGRELQRFVWEITFSILLSVICLLSSLLLYEIPKYMFGLMSILLPFIGLFATTIPSWCIVIPDGGLWLVVNRNKSIDKMLTGGTYFIKPIQSLIFYRDDKPIETDLGNTMSVVTLDGVMLPISGWVEFRFNPLIFYNTSQYTFLSLTDEQLIDTVQEQIYYAIRRHLATVMFSEAMKAFDAIYTQITKDLSHLEALGYSAISFGINFQIPSKIMPELKASLIQLNTQLQDLPSNIPHLDVDRQPKKQVEHDNLINEIFISYSRQDYASHVNQLVDCLQQTGFQIWIDKNNIDGGDDWLNEIVEALKRCDCLILCVSPDALASKYVIMEYRAFIRLDKLIIPIICHDAEMPIELSFVQYLPYDMTKLVTRLNKGKK